MAAVLRTDSEGGGWQARLELGFSRRDGRTLLSRRAHRGPLQVQRPFYPEADGACHAYILHPPGGVVGGDSLHVEVALEAKARALLTTPAAGKFYRSNGAFARATQILRADEGALLEWFPQENIVYNQAQVHSATKVFLRGDACFIGWEIVCLGRPAANERFEQGAYRQSFEIWRDGLPLFLEHGRYEGSSELLRAPWGLNARPVTATLVCAMQRPELVELIRAAADTMQADELFGVSQLDGVLVCRYLGHATRRALYLFTRAWEILRPAVAAKPALAPRVWHT